MTQACVVCSEPTETRHHPTGRDATGRYFDPDLRCPLCHNDHVLQHDDWLTAGIEHAEVALGPLRRRELGLRRLASLFARLESADRSPVHGLGSWLIATAEELHVIADALGASANRRRALRGVPK